MKNGISLVFLIIFFIFITFQCSSNNSVDPIIFKKMVSARNLGIAYLEEERYLC